MRNKRLVNLTESRVNRIISETISNLINELSTDTIDSAKNKGWDKYEKAYRTYGERDPRTKHAESQYQKFKGKWDEDFANGNTARRARMLGNREKRQKGERTYVSGKGWRNKTDDDDSHQAGNASSSLSDWDKYYKFIEMKMNYPKLIALVAVGDYLETYDRDARSLYPFIGSYQGVKEFNLRYENHNSTNAIRFPKELVDEPVFKERFKCVIYDPENRQFQDGTRTINEY